MRGTRARVARHRPTPRGNSHRPGIDAPNPARNSPARPQRALAAGSPTYRRGAAARVPGPHQGHLRRREPGSPFLDNDRKSNLAGAGPPETETSTGKTIGAGAADSRRTHVASGHGGMNFLRETGTRRSSGLLGQSDIDEVASAIGPGSAAGILVYENVWAAPLMAARARTGTSLVGQAPSSSRTSSLLSTQLSRPE